jgi:hypothetical protein
VLVGAEVVSAPPNILFIFVEEVFMKNVMKNVVLAMVCLLVCAGIASADTASIDPSAVWRYVAYTNPAENLYHVGAQASDVLIGQTWSAWVQSGPYACEFRTVVNYDVQASVLGFDSSKVISAKLNFIAAPDFSAARDAVTVDQVTGWVSSGGPNMAEMYSWTVAPGVVTNGSTDGTYSVDITAALKAAIDGALYYPEYQGTMGMAFRFYTDNDADTQLVPEGPLVAPFSDNVVNFYTGYTFSSPTIEVTYIPEPVTVALLGLGGLFLRRRK